MAPTKVNEGNTGRRTLFSSNWKAGSGKSCLGRTPMQTFLDSMRWVKEKSGSAVAEAAEGLIAGRLAAFKLGQREHNRIFGSEDWQSFRRQVADLIERLR